MFQLTYGPYTHQPGECKVDITRAGQVSALGTIPTVLERWSVWGRLLAADTNALNVQVAALQQGYSTQGLDASLVGTNLGIKSANTLGGIRIVKPPCFPDGGNAEGGVFRSYELALEAETIVGGAEAQLVSWQQSLQSTGGGPRFVYLPTLTGPPIAQMTQQQTPYQLVQSGRAVGLLGAPQPPGPLYPQFEHVEQRNISFDSPRPYGSGAGQKNRDYGVSWAYFMESVGPMSGGAGVPNFFVPFADGSVALNVALYGD